MSKYEQLQDELKSIEDEGLRDKLITISKGAFEDMANIKKDIVADRDKYKQNYKDSSSKLSDIQSKLKLDDDFSVTDITERLKNNAEASELETRHKTDLETLRTKLQETETMYNDLETKHNDSNFTNAIAQSGVLGRFSDDTMNDVDMRNVMINKFKQNTILGDDGKLYKKDNLTGKIEIDAITEKPKGIDMVATEILSNLSDNWKKPEIIANGGGATPSTTTPTGKKPSEFSQEERIALYNNNRNEFDRIFKK